MNHPESLDAETFTVWRSPDRFTENPNMVRLYPGDLPREATGQIIRGGET